MSDLTMKQLAQLAGLDISTVSRALRGDSKRVAAATIERVQRLADEHGFAADPLASGLRSGRSRMLGVVVHSLTDIVMGMLVTAIDEAAHALGYLSVVVASHDDPQARAAAIDRLLGRKVDGLILCDSTVGKEIPAQLQSNSVPFVFAMRGCDHAVSVVADDRAGGALVARHFLETGHRQIGYVPGPDHARTALDRAAGFRSVLAGQPHVALAPAPFPGGGYDVEDGYRYTTALLAAGHRPTALFCTNDYTAVGATRALADHDLRVGIDVSVVGYNDIPLAQYLETPLSSVRTDVVAMGQLAAQQLGRLINDKPAEGTVLSPRLIVRASSRPAVPPLPS